MQRAWPVKQFSIDDDVGLDKLFVQNNFQLTMMLVLTSGSNSAPSPEAEPSQSTLSLWIWAKTTFDMVVDWYSLPWLKWLWPKPANKLSKAVPIWILSVRIPLKSNDYLANPHPLEIIFLNGEQIKNFFENAKVRCTSDKKFWLQDTLTSNEKKYIFVSLSGLW